MDANDFTDWSHLFKTSHIMIRVAVDAHVGLHLFQKCIMALRKRGKCIVLVTNALQFIHLCTEVNGYDHVQHVTKNAYILLFSSRSSF
jgi:hypothetical protein